MEMSEAGRAFYFILCDRHVEDRKKAYAAMVDSQVPAFAMLAKAADQIAAVIAGRAAPDTLEDAMTAFCSLRISAEWNGFPEAAGQVVLEKALETEDGKSRETLLRYGLRFVMRSQAGGSTVSSYAMDLVKRAAAAGSDDIKARAQRIEEGNTPPTLFKRLVADPERLKARQARQARQRRT